jgi:hypothetical protein
MMILSSLLIVAAAQAPTIQVEGEGYLRLSRDGRVVYAKKATLAVVEGSLGTTAKASFFPKIAFEGDVSQLRIDANGTVHFGKTQIGKIMLAKFEQGINLTADNGVLISAERPKLGYAETEGFGKIASGAAKESNPTQPISTASTGISTKAQSAIPVVNTKPNNLPLEKSLVILSEAEVSTERIFASDLIAPTGNPKVDEKLAQIEVGYTPIFGTNRKIERSFLAGKLRAAGFALPEGFGTGSAITVTRKSQGIPHSKFIEVAKSALDKAAPTLNYECTEVMGDFFAPLGNVELIVENISGEGTATATVRVGIRWSEGSAAKRLNSRTLKFIAKNDPNAVRQGRPVKVFMRAGGASIEVPGIARAGGAIGTVITVEVNVNGVKTTHQATITGPDQVEVKL